MLRLNRPVLALVAVAALIALHFIYHTPQDHASAIASKLGGKATQRQNKTVDAPLVKSKSKSKSKGRKGLKAKEAISEDGLVIDVKGLTSYVEGKSEKHPIELLIERGRRLAKLVESKEREIESVTDSADDYEKVFKVKPPKGFDTWYKFTRSIDELHPIAAPQLIPFVHKPFDAFLAVPGSILRKRVSALNEQEGYFIFKFVPDGKGDLGTACEKGEEWNPKETEGRGRGRVLVGGMQAWNWRCNNTLHLILPFLPYMPKEIFNQNPPFEIAFSNDDMPRATLSNSFRVRSESLGRSLKTWPKGPLLKAEGEMRWSHGWQWMCPDGAPLKKSNTDLVLNDLDALTNLGAGGEDQTVLAAPTVKKSFIADFWKAADFCYNPDLMTYHHSLLLDATKTPAALIPNVASCRGVRDADIVGVPLDEVFAEVDFVPWTEKSLKKVFWRGSSTGMTHSKKTQWRLSQRHRLHRFAQDKSDATATVLVDRGGNEGGVVSETWRVKDLNAAWLDVGLSGKPNQCNVEDGTCAEMAEEIDFLPILHKAASVKYKFVFDVDGNGWSSRFRRLLAGNNVVMKSTLYPEWYSEQLIPWYHYVPVKLDYSDMYDIMSFFTGAPDGSTVGRDDLAEEIAANGLRFTQEKWRMSDMQSYTFLLILEMWRLMSDDREEMSYQMDL